MMGRGDVLRWVLALPLAGLLLYGGTLPYRVERYVEGLNSGTIPLETAKDFRLSYEPSLVAARLMMQRGGFDADRIRGHLEHALRSRPLYAPAWLDLAALEFSVGNRAAALLHAERAHSLWPTRRRHLWRLGQLYLRMGEQEKALQVIGDYLVTDPAQTQRVLITLLKLGIARQDIAAGVARPSLDLPERHDRALITAMRYAQKQRDIELAEALWSHLPQRLKAREEVAAPALALAATMGETESFCRFWQEATNDRVCFNQVYDGEFQLAPEMGYGRGWRINNRAQGVETTVEDIDGNRVLVIRFAGTDNVNYFHTRQWVPIRGASKLVLSGRWRGDDVTTRSGVMVGARQMCADKDRYRAITGPKYGAWDWRDFSAEIDVGEACPFLEIYVSRRPTKALDRNIAGTVFIDDLQMEVIN